MNIGMYTTKDAIKLPYLALATQQKLDGWKDGPEYFTFLDDHFH